MKKIVSLVFIACLLCTMLAACGKDKAESNSAPASQSELDGSSNPAGSSSPASDSSSIPEMVVDRNPYPGQTSMGGDEISLVMYAASSETEPPTIILTLEQQNHIAQELQSLMAKFESGEYPVEVEEDMEPSGFSAGWPNDVGFPKTAPVKQLIFTTVGHEAYPMSVQVALPKGWFMECALVVDGADGTEIDYASEENYWVPATAHFIDPNGLVHDEPGETDIDGGAAIVLS